MMFGRGKRLAQCNGRQIAGWICFFQGAAAMATMILDPLVENEVLTQRAASDGERFDEVWEGVYVRSPLPDNEHQEIASRLNTAIQNSVGWSSDIKILPGVNVSNRRRSWKSNYRCPDVAAFAANTKARNCGTDWYGGPDFAVEITSPHDRSREKLEFYGKVGVIELLLIDRKKWKLELYRLSGEELELEGTSSVKDSKRLACRVLGVTFRLVAGRPRPAIEVKRGDGQSWLV
jgi:Uma2 family endonuclease